MKKLTVLFAMACVAASSAAQTPAELARWQAQARHVTITRDDWGIPHVRGKTDADAVFGMIYAQAEDDFHRIEVNYLNAMGRLAEAEGEQEIWRDLRMKLFMDPAELRTQYAASPTWLQRLMTAWADGLNFYLKTHPDVRPMVLTHFEPWMALSFTEGSIGGDISTVSLKRLEAFYGAAAAPSEVPAEPTGDDAAFTGSNGIAIAPSLAKNHHALLLINPHTNFYFREELQMTSDDGLNAYGAVTWGQFFVYQGFNERAGWMHTSSKADVVDEYAETIVRHGDRYAYRYGTGERPLGVSKITVAYRTPGGMKTRAFTVYRTHHGPIVRVADGKWISVRLMNEPVKALTQSYLRTKARDYSAFRATMELHTNSSNNTIFADALGNIAYLHANHVARRDRRFDFTRPVDGSDPATEWGPMHAVEDSPFVLNPPNGWLYNSNNWPYSAAGPHSPKKSEQPSYMDTAGENPRGFHAIALLSSQKEFTVQSLRDAAYDSYQPAFAELIPSLLKSYDATAADDPLRAALSGQAGVLRAWDFRWNESSVATTLAVAWGDEVWRDATDSVARDGVAFSGRPEREGLAAYDYIASRMSAAQHLQALVRVSKRLTDDFGTWHVAWGDFNRFQRRTGDIEQPFDDAAPSIAVGFAPARWGSLASFEMRSGARTKRRYGTYGNSFVAVVEFGTDSVRARAVTAGGLNSVVGSKHFNDQAGRYATGDLREVYFYSNQLAAHTERRYRPGDR